MAKSFAHKWGQMIGDLLESALLPPLTNFAKHHALYLDKKGTRPARASEKVTWIDGENNAHDLDFVLERGGSQNVIGVPAAFVETAWRRYTKHSRNKVQEIQSAVLPLIAAHHKAAPFIGAVLAGEFTAASIQQLKSNKFTVLHFSYESVKNAFAKVGLDASFHEKTPEREFKAKIAAWHKASDEQRKEVAEALIASNKTGLDEFIAKLEQAIKRIVVGVSVTPLHGCASEVSSITAAIQFIENYDGKATDKPLFYYLVSIRYGNQDQIEGKFAGKDDTIQFLRDYEPPPIKPAALNPLE